MDIRSIILGFLNFRDMSGYDIKQFFSNNVGLIYDASYGAIYPTLRKLEQEELVTKNEIVQVGKPNKILYSITQKGKDEFYKQMLTPIEPPVFRSDSLVRLFFAGQLPAKNRQELLEKSIQFQKQLYKHLQKTYENLNDLDPYQQTCWEYSLMQLENTIRFFEQKKAQLSELDHTLQTYQ